MSKSPNKAKKTITAAVGVLLVAVVSVGANLADLPDSFAALTARSDRTQFLDRSGEPLNATYQSYWNTRDAMALHDMPPLLVKMFVFAEDKNFYDHGGVDWAARGAAVWQNVRAGGIVRGASTLTEQVARMIAPRKRTLFSKIVEGIDAARLERRFSKNDILEFYLNQVPYAANRRGIKQAARHYFSKTPDRLSVREAAALVVLVRAPSSFDPYRGAADINGLIDRRLESFAKAEIITPEQLKSALGETLKPAPPELTVEAPHFLRYLRDVGANGGAVDATLDAWLQKKVAGLTRRRLKNLAKRNAGNAAVLVADVKTGDILVWAVESGGKNASAVNAVLTPRQPASAQKPLLYALALTKGMRASTKITDAPFSRAVGQGVHHFKNYSRTHYGAVTVRRALGNSLNIPALKTIEFVGVENYFRFLLDLGFARFDRGADYYREGLALGNAEATLFELTRAYLMLANGGVLKPLRAYKGQAVEPDRRVLPETAATLIGDILSDPFAREFEFGRDSVLNFPVQTAVKTGTSTGYRDAWAMGYNADFVAGVWIGNLDYSPMIDVTGASGAGLLLRSVFTELNKIRNSGGLRLSDGLVAQTVGGETEYFDPDVAETYAENNAAPVVLSPENGVMLAVDPRVPVEWQAYPFSVSDLPDGARVLWFVDGEKTAATTQKTFLWRPVKGSHTVVAEIVDRNGGKTVFPARTVIVK